MSHCVGTPISWLRLESLAAGDVATSEEQAIRKHLDDCPVCAGCLETIERDHRVLPSLNLAPSLPVVSFGRLKRALVWSIGGGVAVAAIAAFIYVIVGVSPPPQPEMSNRVAIKGGGELALTVVRMRGDVQTPNATDFAEGDRFKVALTCSEPGEVELDAVVIQGRKVYRPLGERPAIRCGNNVLLPGAFAAGGSQSITVCIAPRVNRRGPLTFGSRNGAACAVLTPAP